MLKKNKIIFIVSSAVILLPIVFGLFVWDRLPEQMAIHWNSEGVADDYASKAVAVFAMPCFLFVMQLLSVLVTGFDKKNKGQSEKVFQLVLLICPFLSCFLSVLIYAQALGRPMDVSAWMVGFIGILFVVLGNYLPKCKQNATIGIRIKWTLENEENWNATHRLAGKVWVVGGFLQTVVCLLVPTEAVFAVFMTGTLLLVLIPMLYSYQLHKKQKQSA